MNELPVIIRLPLSFSPERQYVIDIVFREFLGLSYELIPDETLVQKYVIRLGGKEIVLTDAFFSHCDEREGYLLTNRMPKVVPFLKNRFLVEENTPLLFGSDEMIIGNDRIVCGMDLFASVFFMLSRWEEYVITKRDYLARFPAQEALAFKFDFLHRPVVNEWIELLKNMLRHLVPEMIFKPEQSFGIVFTHDIDLLNAPVTLKEFAKDIFKRKSLSAFVKRAGYLVKGINPYNVFDYFMDTSERHHTLSRFYFMTGHNVPGRDGEPYNNTPFYKKILKHIQSRGHVIGFHPSLLSYNDPSMFAREKAQLEGDLGAKVTEGRQHALRFDLPDTWNIWDSNGMQTDSTLGYSAREGFRCGTGNTFPVYDVKRRKRLGLKEMPLVVMDTTLNVNRKLKANESKNIILRYIRLGKKFDMPITLLFHNLIEDSIDWKGWKGLYDDIFVNGEKYDY